MSDYEFKLPDIGEGLSEGEIVHWHVGPGDSVKADQTIVDVQTDKAVVEIPAPVAGVIKTLGGDPGDVLPIGSLLVVIDSNVSPPPASAAHAAPAPSGPATETPPSAAPALSASALPVNGGRRRVLASPATRKFAVEQGVDLTTITGTGNRGQITKDDVRRAAAGGAPAVASGAPMPSKPIVPVEGADRAEPLRGLRRQIAVTMAEAWREIPHILTTLDIDAANLVAARAALVEELAQAGVKPSYMPLIMKAAAAALRRYPTFNASLDMAGQQIIFRHRVNIGFAAATPDGLIVPVVHDVDRKPLLTLVQEINALAEAARARKITVDQLQGGTFTISNYGSYGGQFGTPIIRPPEVAILGVGAIRDAVVPVDGAPAVRKIMTLVVSTDHRLNDGEHLGQFAGAIADYLREPVRLLGQL